MPDVGAARVHGVDDRHRHRFVRLVQTHQTATGKESAAKGTLEVHGLLVLSAQAGTCLDR
jgi:hypothetical protein